MSKTSTLTLIGTRLKTSMTLILLSDAIFYVGGHGPVLDLASDPVNAKLASEVSIREIVQWSSG